MNPDTNKFEPVFDRNDERVKNLEDRFRELNDALVRENDELVPKNWPVFSIGEELGVKGYRFRVKEIHPDCMVLESVGPVKKNQTEKNRARKNRQRNKRRKSRK